MTSYFDDLDFVHHGYRQQVSLNAERKLFNGYYVVQFILRGAVFAQFGDAPEERAEGPCAFITYPGVPTSYGSIPGTSREQMFLAFRGARVQRYVEGGLLELRRENVFIPVAQCEELRQLFLKIFTFLQKPEDEEAHARSVLLLEDLLLRLSRQSRQERISSSPYRHQLEELRVYLVSHPEQPWDFAAEARRLQISYSHFCHVFRDFAGKPPQQYLVDCRVLKAQRMLTNSTLLVNEIAGQCGFPSAFYFYRTFRNRIGMSPALFRKQYGIVE